MSILLMSLMKSDSFLAYERRGESFKSLTNTVEENYIYMISNLAYKCRNKNLVMISI
jgi:hypothetical protein